MKNARRVKGDLPGVYVACLQALAVIFNGAPEGSRTPNLLIRSQVLYPIELRVRPRHCCRGGGIVVDRFLGCKHLAEKISKSCVFAVWLLD